MRAPYVLGTLSGHLADTWRTIASLLDNCFTFGQLLHFWTQFSIGISHLDHRGEDVLKTLLQIFMFIFRIESNLPT